MQLLYRPGYSCSEDLAWDMYIVYILFTWPYYTDLDILVQKTLPGTCILYIYCSLDPIIQTWIFLFRRPCLGHVYCIYIVHSTLFGAWENTLSTYCSGEPAWDMFFIYFLGDPAWDMRRYFIGGTQELMDIQECGNPTSG